MSDNESGSMAAIVAIIAIVVILGVGFFVMRNFMGTTPKPGTTVQVTLPGLGSSSTK